ncbi:MAG: hypothetical protein IPL61_31695 [Myxococcales bacterium]|nr:hypothetical protein [Myxococcales bacterium]
MTAPAPPQAASGRGLLRRLGSRLATVARILAHFAGRGRWFLLPVVIVLLLAGVLLLVTSGLSYVAPFVYSIF